MTRLPVISAEKPQQCDVCGDIKELRPYGKDGACICFDCMMATPESQAEAKKRFSGALKEVQGG